MKKKVLNLKFKSTLMTLFVVLSLSLSLQTPPLMTQNTTQTSLHVQALLANLISAIDKDKDGIDDYTDIMLGARGDALNMPTYDDKYWQGGYPPDNVGVCADTIWRALLAAGYNLKDLLDADIKSHPSVYPRTGDPNIDFRRVRNLRIFFDRHLVQLTLNIYETEQWQPGDIVIMYDDFHHTGIVSDQRNFMGIPYLIHNTGQKDREEDILMYAYYHAKITRHYRWIYTP